MATRLILVGGFLGAGKSTLILNAAERLRKRGMRVGIVTNDQGDDLVDTAFARQMDLEVTEVAGGCFCCNFPDLMKSIETLEEKIQPDVIIAEPVGSCTDLVATILRPLSLHYPGRFELAPLSILVDPNRTLAGFDESVEYLYDKQLQEADLIIGTKNDSLSEEQMVGFRTSISGKFPGADYMEISSKKGINIDQWLGRVMNEISAADASLELDYALYGKAEATLGWLNAKGTITSDSPFHPSGWIVSLMTSAQETFKQMNTGMAHVKIFASPAEDPAAAFKASLTGADTPLSWDSWHKGIKTKKLPFLFNVRVNMDPDRLEMIVKNMLAMASEEIGVELSMDEFSCFSPPPPEPTHRIPAGTVN